MTPGSRQLGAQVTDCRPRHSSAECHPRVTYSSPHMLCCQIQERRGRRQRPDTKRHCHKMSDMQFLQTEPMTSANRARVSCIKEAQHDKGRCLRTAKRVSRHPPRGPTYPATRTNITRHADQHTPPRGPTYPAALSPSARRTLPPRTGCADTRLHSRTGGKARTHGQGLAASTPSLSDGVNSAGANTSACVKTDLSAPHTHSDQM